MEVLKFRVHQRRPEHLVETSGQGFQPCFEAGIRELPFLMPEPAEKSSLRPYTGLS